VVRGLHDVAALYVVGEMLGDCPLYIGV